MHPMTLELMTGSELAGSAMPTMLPATTGTALSLSPLLSPLRSLLTVGGWVAPWLGINASSVNQFVADLRQSSGNLALNQGILTADLTNFQGQNLQTTLNLSELASDVLAALPNLDGSLLFDRGIVTPNLPGLNSPLNFAELLGGTIASLLTDLSGPVNFADGRFLINAPTPLGTFSGSIDFAGGALVTDLTTPFGDLDLTLPFPETARLPIDLGPFEALVDLPRGVVSVDLLPGIPGGDVALSLRDFSGTVRFDQGQAQLSIASPAGNFTTNFDIATLAKDATIQALSGTGTVTFTDGVVNIDATGPIGTVKTSLDLAPILRTAANFLSQTQGNLQLNGGILTAQFTSPTGSYTDRLDLQTLDLSSLV
jgi:hypothetical protein